MVPALARPSSSASTLWLVALSAFVAVAAFGFPLFSGLSNRDQHNDEASKREAMLEDAAKPALEKAGLKPEMAEVTMKPGSDTELKGDDAAKMQRLLDALEGLDDVQEVYSTAVIDSSG